MSGEEEYEIMPHKTIESIKKELDALKKKADSKESTSNEEFKTSLDNLSSSINGLMGLFKEATEEMKLEEETESELSKKIGPLMDKIDALEQENKAIAKAILSVADLVKEMKQQPPQKDYSRGNYSSGFSSTSGGKNFKPIPKPKIVQEKPSNLQEYMAQHSGSRHTFEPHSLGAPGFGSERSKAPYPNNQVNNQNKNQPSDKPNSQNPQMPPRPFPKQSSKPSPNQHFSQEGSQAPQKQAFSPPNHTNVNNSAKPGSSLYQSEGNNNELPPLPPGPTPPSSSSGNQNLPPIGPPPPTSKKKGFLDKIFKK